MAFFLCKGKDGKRERIAYNDLCKNCTKDCKQSYRTEVVCARYTSKRTKKKKLPKKTIF